MSGNISVAGAAVVHPGTRAAAWLAAVLAMLCGCTVPPPVPVHCGDGIVDSPVGEQCDPGGVNTAICDRDCTRPECGDGYINPAAGEECDDGGQVSGDGCSATCRSEDCGDGNGASCVPAECGDRHVNAAAGEQCDDGNVVSGDGCSADCRSDETCGNGIVDAARGEQCDDAGESAACDNDCTLALCGDFVVNALAVESCDEGGEDTATCNWNCTAPLCGDGHVNPAAGEDCETGVETAFCDSDCTFALCGDGTPNAAAGEECDDGNADDSDGCLSSCVEASCDDGILNGDEEGVDCGEVCDENCPVTQPMVVAGAYHTCALLETGAVRCWGTGGSGRLGYGNTNNIGDNETPAAAGDVNVGGVVVQLVAGWDHTCALLETGAVRCWGDGENGQLGYGNTNNIGDNETPAAAGDVNVGGVVVQLVAGVNHTCALLETGAVRCWGYGLKGRLGYGNLNFIGDDEAPATAGDVNVGGIVVQLTAGWSHTCALLETGVVRCWGDGLYGQLGYGNTNIIGDNEAPAAAGNVNVGGVVAQLAAGGYHTCALLETGAVRCWGDGRSGQLGYGNTNTIGDNEAPATAGNVAVGGVVVQLAAGGYHTCAALLETGAVRCWGYGGYGQLGYGNTSYIGDNEAPVTAGNVNVGGVVAQLEAGEYYTCALLETGAVRCWGAGGNGQLGYGNTSNIGDNESPALAGDVPYR